MIASAIINPLTIVFFTIFDNLNSGIKYPLYVIIPGLFCSIIATILWIKGEKK
ncbi:MAG: hypothetical protein Edafosvirus37_14, partial [Edafosvirus sp.]